MRNAQLPIVFSLVLLVSCSGDDGANPNPHPVDSGIADAASEATSDAPPSGLGASTPPPDNPGPGSILFTASGEVLALGGYPFPPASSDAVAFVDGWEVKFTRLIVTVDAITLSENPDKSPTDPSQTDAAVATVSGPWAIDLHQGGKLPGKGGSGEQAVPLAALTAKNDGSAFDPTRRYAFGFDLIAATPSAMNVNLDADGLNDYREMIATGATVLYVGTARFKGGTSCASPTPGYDFGKLPQTVSFRFAFKSPTRYVNCQNPDNDPAGPFAGEEHQRGVQVKASTFVVAQVTVHTDHPFWESVVHDSPAHFDPIAARFVGMPSATATLDALSGVDFTAFRDSTGAALPWRSCVPSYTAKSGTMGFDPQSVPVNPSADPSSALRDYRDFMTYNQSTQGHLNSDGLCYVQRRYASPR